MYQVKATIDKLIFKKSDECKSNISHPNDI